MFDQDKFNTLCDRYVIAKIAEIRYDWLLSEDGASDWATLQKVTEDVVFAGYDLENMVLNCQEVDREDLKDHLDMLQVVASALFIVNPNLPEGMKKPGNTWSPMVNWFASYITRAGKFWHVMGRREVLMDAAINAAELLGS